MRIFILIFLLLIQTQCFATSTDYLGDASDGVLTTSNATGDWDAAHDASSADSINTTGTTFTSQANVDSTADPLNYTISRIGLVFDTSGITDTDVIISAQIILRAGVQVPSEDDGSVCITTFTPATPNSLVVGDFDQFGGCTTDSQGISTGTETFNIYHSSLGNISKTGFTNFGIRMILDVNDTAPTKGINSALFNSTDSASDPTLRVVTDTGVVHIKGASILGGNIL